MPLTLHNLLMKNTVVWLMLIIAIVLSGNTVASDFENTSCVACPDIKDVSETEKQIYFYRDE